MLDAHSPSAKNLLILVKFNFSSIPAVNQTHFCAEYKRTVHDFCRCFFPRVACRGFFSCFGFNCHSSVFALNKISSFAIKWWLSNAVLSLCQKDLCLFYNNYGSWIIHEYEFQCWFGYLWYSSLQFESAVCKPFNYLVFPFPDLCLPIS